MNPIHENRLIDLSNHFLIAMPGMDDPNFQQTVTYICEHNENGALGLVINRPMENIQLGDVLSQMDIIVHNIHVGSTPILYGGPVHQERGFVIHRPFGNWRSSFDTTDGIVVTTSKDILQAIAEDRGPTDILVTLGYAGWNPGQLEKELSENLWLITPSDPSIFFDTPCEERWAKAAMLLGIDIHSLAGYAGHA